MREPTANTRALTFLETVLDAWKLRRWRCQACPLVSVKEGPHFAYGRINTPVMVVAQNPGGETRDSSPRRPSEKLRLTVRESYLKNGWDESESRELDYLKVLRLMTAGTKFENYQESLYYTNAIKCPPSHRFGLRDKPRNRERALLHCEVYLAGELAAIDPKVVVAFGLEAALAILDCEGIARHELPRAVHCQRIALDHGTRTLIVFRHWGSVRGHVGGYYRTIRREFRRALRDTGLAG